MYILKDSVKSLKNLQKREVSKAIRVQRRISIAVILVVIIAFVVSYILYGDYLYETFCDKDNLQAFLAQFGGFDRVAFIAIRTFQTVVKIIPAEPIEIAAGAFYGTFPGMLYCVIGSVIGCVIITLITKKVGRKVVNLFVPIEVIDDFSLFKNKDRMYLSLFFIYLIPSAPKDLLVYAAALTDIHIGKFLLITTIARIPGILISTWCGTEFIEGNYTKAILIFAVSMVLAIALSIIYKKVLSKKKTSQEGK